jgi:membrane associated rhomboid family serine protease
MGFSFLNRYGSQYWFKVGTVQVTTTVLITGLSALSLFVFAADPTLLRFIELDTTALTSLQLWRLLTWPALNAPGAGLLLSVLINLLMFFLFGRELEALLGRKRFLWFLLILTVVPALATTALVIVLNQPFFAGGILVLATGIIGAYVATNPTARSWFNVPLWVFFVVILAINLLYFTGVRDWGDVLFLMITVAVGMMLARSFGISRIAWIPAIPLPATVTGDRTNTESKKRKHANHLKVVESTTLDTLLDKISQQGIDSLTPQERRQLDELSRGRGN